MQVPHNAFELTNADLVRAKVSVMAILENPEEDSGRRIQAARELRAMYELLMKLQQLAATGGRVIADDSESSPVDPVDLLGSVRVVG